MRIESDIALKNGGWLHLDISRRIIPARMEPPVANINFVKMRDECITSDIGSLPSFAATLGVPEWTLKALGCFYSNQHHAFGFPMYDAAQKIIGIRLRSDLGHKWSVKGSKNGVFTTYPRCYFPKEPTLIVEGPTDSAAALYFNFNVIGRPSCLGGAAIIKEMVKELDQVYIIADNDDKTCPVCHGGGCKGCHNSGLISPGKRGAYHLAQRIKAKTVLLPDKDLRDFKKNGGTRELLLEHLRYG